MQENHTIIQEKQTTIRINVTTKQRLSVFKTPCGGSYEKVIHELLDYFEGM